MFKNKMRIQKRLWPNCVLCTLLNHHCGLKNLDFLFQRLDINWDQKKRVPPKVFSYSVCWSRFYADIYKENIFIIFWYILNILASPFPWYLLASIYQNLLFLALTKLKLTKSDKKLLQIWLLKYGFWKKSLRKNATLNSWTLFSSQKGTCTNES